MAGKDCQSCMNIRRVLLYAAMYAAIGACVGAGLALYTQKASEELSAPGVVPDILTQRRQAVENEINKHRPTE